MAASTEPNVGSVELGFAEVIDNKWKLLSHFFPSKIGGKPAWLTLEPVPVYDDVKCGVCGKPCVFLLQVYAPFDENSHSFHRTVYLFICRDPVCNKADGDNIIVLRSQLPKDNRFYSSDPPEEMCIELELYPSAEQYQALCSVCGCTGPKTCAKCHTVNYCGRDHQVADWKTRHKSVCGKQLEELSKKSAADHDSRVLFPELDLVTEPEDLPASDKSEKSEEAKLQEYKKVMESLKVKGSLIEGDTDGDLQDMASKEEDADDQLLQFKERISAEPEQVLRYQKGGAPLWLSSSSQADPEQIPNCSCGAKRLFEFQVMPQLLTHLKVDSIGDSLDWGTLAVYTCSSSCLSSHPYHPEFVWKQNFSTSST